MVRVGLLSWDFILTCGTFYFDLATDINVFAVFLASGGRYEIYAYIQIALTIVQHMWQGYSTLVNDIANPINNRSGWRKASTKDKLQLAKRVLITSTPIGLLYEWWHCNLTAATYDPEKQSMGPKLKLANTKLINMVAGTMPEAMLQLHSYATLLMDEGSRLDDAATAKVLAAQRTSLIVSTITVGIGISFTNIRTELAWSGFWSRFSLYGYLPENSQRARWALMYISQAMIAGGYFVLALFGLSMSSAAMAEWLDSNGFESIDATLLGVFFPVSLLLTEFACFVGYKIWIGEMWHPGTIVQSTWYADNVTGFLEKFPNFIGSMILWRLPNRDPRRTAPHVFFFCVTYRLILSNVLVVVSIFAFYVPSLKMPQESRKDEMVIILGALNGELVLGAVVMYLCINKKYDKRWFLFRRYNGKQLYRDIFQMGEHERSFTKLATKDQERAFFIRTRHAIWLPIDMIEAWLCEDMHARYMAAVEEERPARPPFLLTDDQMRAFEQRLRQVFDYHKRAPNVAILALREIRAACKAPDPPKSTDASGSSRKRRPSRLWLALGATTQAVANFSENSYSRARRLSRDLRSSPGSSLPNSRRGSRELDTGCVTPSRRSSAPTLERPHSAGGDSPAGVLVRALELGTPPVASERTASERSFLRPRLASIPSGKNVLAGVSHRSSSRSEVGERRSSAPSVLSSRESVRESVRESARSRSPSPSRGAERSRPGSVSSQRSSDVAEDRTSYVSEGPTEGEASSTASMPMSTSMSGSPAILPVPPRTHATSANGKPLTPLPSPLPQRPASESI